MRKILIFFIIPWVLLCGIYGANALITLEGTFVDSGDGLVSGVKKVTVRLVDGRGEE